MTPPDVDRPVFLVGMPRSGTTVLFEAFATHPDLGWFSYHLERFPRFPPVAVLARLCDVSPFFRKAVTPAGRARPWLERLRDGPSEAYSVWAARAGERFRYDYLLGQRATPEERETLRRLVRDVLRWQGKRRFTAKLTGPARMGYLLSVFPDARFVHVVRDGRDVVRSLLRVDFWSESRRMTEPAWRGGLRDDHLRAWESRGRAPWALAALQWRNVIERTREERDACRPERYAEVRYEDFLADPDAVLERLWELAEIPPSAWTRRFVAERLRLERRQEPAPRAEARAPEAFSDADLEELLGDLLADLGYGPAGGRGPSSSRASEA